jgi:hypothetical protein
VFLRIMNALKFQGVLLSPDGLVLFLLVTPFLPFDSIMRIDRWIFDAGAYRHGTAGLGIEPLVELEASSICMCLCVIWQQ